jgi:hypothetical protein
MQLFTCIIYILLFYIGHEFVCLVTFAVSQWDQVRKNAKEDSECDVWHRQKLIDRQSATLQRSATDEISEISYFWLADWVKQTFAFCRVA